jgi:hypothetical protein
MHHKSRLFQPMHPLAPGFRKLRWKTWMLKGSLLERRLRSPSHSYFMAYIAPDNTIDLIIHNCANNVTFKVLRSDGVK